MMLMTAGVKPGESHLEHGLACHPGCILCGFIGGPAELGINALAGDVDATADVALAQEVVVFHKQLHTVFASGLVAVDLGGSAEQHSTGQGICHPGFNHSMFQLT